MDRIPEVELIAAAALGFVLQWARAPKNVPNWLSWAGVVIVGGFMWIWMTPSALVAFQADWRRSLVAVVMLIMAAQGNARALADMKAAPNTNTK